MSPGSGLNKYLDQQGFSVVGYGCTTCIGNSGDLHEDVSEAIAANGMLLICRTFVVGLFLVVAVSCVTYQQSS